MIDFLLGYFALSVALGLSVATCYVMTDARAKMSPYLSYFVAFGLTFVCWPFIGLWLITSNLSALANGRRR